MLKMNLGPGDIYDLKAPLRPHALGFVTPNGGPGHEEVTRSHVLDTAICFSEDYINYALLLPKC